MKQSPELNAIQDLMRPGALTAHGFLGTDGRSIVDMIEDDDARVKRLCLTHAAIAARMIELRDAGARGLGEFVNVEDDLEVRVDSVRGKLPCPFGDRGMEQKGFTVVRNKPLGREISYTDLNIHLIEAHGFYEGRGSAFRLDPEELVAVLGVEYCDDEHRRDDVNSAQD